jgi:hypothetical protein
VPRKEQNEATNFFTSLIAKLELQLNTTKSDSLDRIAWGTRGVTADTEELARLFHGLMSTVELFISQRPTTIDDLRLAFRNDGFSLPFERLRAAPVDSDRAKWLARLFGPKGFLSNWHIWFNTPAKMLGLANHVRNRFLKEHWNAAQKVLPQSGMRRRWDLQKRRFLTNRLLYLLPAERYSELYEALPDVTELTELRGLVEGLRSGDATPILTFAGSTPAVFGMLWKETRNGVAKIDWSRAPRREERDSAASLLAFGACDAPHEWVSKFQLNSQTMLRCFTEAGLPEDDERRLISTTMPGFVRELACLRRSVKGPVSAFALSRFSDDEDLAIEANPGGSLS